jgi:hypothetical protein
VAAGLVIATAVPLALLQVPDAIAWAVPAPIAAAGPGAVTGLLRLSGLALTAMVIAAPLGALAVRRVRAWPVVLAGLALMTIADLAAGGPPAAALIGADRVLHGVGAGLVLTATAALAAERRRGAGLRVLAGWWAACLVTGLVVAAGLLRQVLAAGDWRTALVPFGWLTGAALAAAALYAVLAEGAVTGAIRTTFPVADRARLALLTAPVAGMGAIAIAVSFDQAGAVTTAAVAEALSLAGLVVMTVRSGGARWFTAACVVAGFTLCPAGGTVAALLQAAPGARPALGPVLVALAAGAVSGAAVAVLVPGPRARATTGLGAAVAAAGFGGCYLAAGPDAVDARPHLFVIACLPVAGGLAAALTAALRGDGAPGSRPQPAGAMCGVVLMLAGVLAGYLSDGAIELRAVTAAISRAQPVSTALTGAAARWDLVAAALTAVLAAAVLVSRPRRVVRGEVDHVAGAPRRDPGATPRAQ